MSIRSFFRMSRCSRLCGWLGLALALIAVGVSTRAHSGTCGYGCDCGIGYCMLSGYPGAHYGQFDSTWCSFVYSPTAYDATPDNLFVGQMKYAFVPNDKCPCEGVTGIGDPVLDSPSLDTDWEEAEYYTYCNPCLPSD